MTEKGSFNKHDPEEFSSDEERQLQKLLKRKARSQGLQGKKFQLVPIEEDLPPVEIGGNDLDDPEKIADIIVTNEAAEETIHESIQRIVKPYYEGFRKKAEQQHDLGKDKPRISGKAVLQKAGSLASGDNTRFRTVEWKDEGNDFVDVKSKYQLDFKIVNGNYVPENFSVNLDHTYSHNPSTKITYHFDQNTVSEIDIEWKKSGFDFRSYLANLNFYSSDSERNNTNKNPELYHFISKFFNFSNERQWHKSRIEHDAPTYFDTVEKQCSMKLFLDNNPQPEIELSQTIHNDPVLFGRRYITASSSMVFDPESPSKNFIRRFNKMFENQKTYENLAIPIISEFSSEDFLKLLQSAFQFVPPKEEGK